MAKVERGKMRGWPTKHREDGVYLDLMVSRVSKSAAYPKKVTDVGGFEPPPPREGGGLPQSLHRCAMDAISNIAILAVFEYSRYYLRNGIGSFQKLVFCLFLD